MPQYSARTAGKTTLLRLLLSLQKGATGTVQLSAPAAYVPQLSGALFNYSVRTMVSLGGFVICPVCIPVPHDHDITEQAMADLGLTRFADTSFNLLSGGEKQMVMIARALAGEPDILILDEPTSALDLANQDTVLSVLKMLAAERGKTILFTSHYPQHALHIADYSLLLFDGTQAQFGQTPALLTEENLGKLYQLPVSVVPVNHPHRQTCGVIPLFR